MKYNKFFIIALICALIAGGLGALAYNRIGKMVPVAAARQDIQPYQAATKNNTGITFVPQSAVQEDTVIKASDLKGYSSKGYIPAGTVLRSSMFIKTAQANVSGRLKPGQVAVAVKSDIETTIGGNVRPGDRVNIVRATATLDNPSDILMLAENVPVLTINENAISVALNRQQAEIFEKNKHMKINFELRSSDDLDVVR